jgi:hypothetical protein
LKLQKGVTRRAVKLKGTDNAMARGKGTDNAMARGKGTDNAMAREKGQTMINKNTTQKNKDKVYALLYI